MADKFTGGKYLLRLIIGVFGLLGSSMLTVASAKPPNLPIAKARGAWLMCKVQSAADYQISTLELQRAGQRWLGELRMTNLSYSEVPAHFSGLTAHNQIEAKIFQTAEDVSQHGELRVAESSYRVYLVGPNRLVLKAAGAKRSDTYQRVKSVSAGYESCAKRVGV